MEGNFFEKLKDVQLIALDVDGVLTDNSLLCTEDGQLLRTMNARDGYAMAKAVKEGIQLIIITGGSSSGVLQRLENLGNIKVFSGIHKKLAVLQQYCLENNISRENTFYMGDDILDMSSVQWAGISACPKDAVQEVKSLAQYICEMPGGKGCVREVIELILRHQNKWLNTTV